MQRYLYTYILKDLKKKMVLIVGARQVGKTYLARSMEKEFKRPSYLNYDNPEQALIIRKRQWPLDADLIILDEIHKMAGWKNFLKGIYDTKPSWQSILVTGSARLDIRRRSGDSLAGRYFQYRLNPLSLKELSGGYDSIKKLNELGGFPEPFFSGSSEDANRWRKQYFTGIIREDILELSRIHEIKTLEILLELLRQRVGTPISYLSLSRDLEISPHTVKNYIDLLEALYVVFLVRPFHRNIARSILKEPKLYFYDSGFVKGDEGLRFENTVAVSLKKHAQYMEDVHGETMELNYLRTKDGREIDFVITKDGEAETVIEAKLSDTDISPAFKYFREILKSEFIQIVLNTRTEKEVNGIKVLPAAKWLAKLSA